jgi:hypothetical protein
MFHGSQFNGDISSWNVSKVWDMRWMFCASPFDGDLSEWKIDDFCLVDCLFKDSAFEKSGAVKDWMNVFSLRRIEHAKNPDGKIVANDNAHLRELIKVMIELNGFDCDLNVIDVSNVTDMSAIFYKSPFNGDISQWNVSNVTCMNRMFAGSSFDGDISNWNVSNVKDMCYMFYGALFAGDIDGWDVSNVSGMYEIFSGSVLEKSGKLPKWYKGK